MVSSFLEQIEREIMAVRKELSSDHGFHDAKRVARRTVLLKHIIHSKTLPLEDRVFTLEAVLFTIVDETL